jgi:CBS domain-containing protein
MLCQEIMKRNVECISPDESAVLAAQKMRDQNIGFLPICDDDMSVLGTITDRDIAIRLVAEGLPGSTPVEEVMTPEVVACKPSDDVRKVEQLMGRHQKSRIMCLDDDGHLIGVVSLSDIAQHEGKRAVETMRQVTDREAHV